MNVKKGVSSFGSNWLFALILISLLAQICIGLEYYITFPYIYHIEPEQSGVTILGILVAVFVLFFASTQILYYVSDIPIKLLIRYSIRTRESYSLIFYFLITIFICSLTVIHYPIIYKHYFLLGNLLCSLIIITGYFFWFTKRITVDEIINQITLEAAKTLKKINEFEQSRQKDYTYFHNFIKSSEGKYRYDLTYFLQEKLLNRKHASFTLKTKLQKDTTISEIKVNQIKQKLEKITVNSHVKIIFEVEPTLIVPIKNPYHRMLDNYRLITILFEKEGFEQEDEYEKIQEKFIRDIEGDNFEMPDNEDDKSKFLFDQVSDILRRYGQSLEGCFVQMEHKKWTSKVDLALDSLKSMFQYNLRNEYTLDPLCSGLEEIIYNQFLTPESGVFLGLRSNRFRRIGEIFKEINEFSLRNDQTKFLNKMLELFYKIVFTNKEVKDQLIFVEVLDGIRYFNSLFVTTAPHNYNFLVEILVLNIRELATESIRKDFDTETNIFTLEIYHKSILEKGVDTAFNVVKDYIEWYNEDSLHNQIYLKKQIQHLIEFSPFYKDSPEDYFSKPSDYYRVRQALHRSLDVKDEDQREYELAVKKASIVKEIKNTLQKKIMQLSILMIKRYMDRELDPEIIWKIALPAAKSSCHVHGFQSFFTNRFNDYRWQHDTQDLFRWSDIHPSGAHELHGFNLNIFWIIFNVYLGPESFFPLNAKELLKKGLLQSFEFIDANFWAKALNMKPIEFENRLKQYLDTINGIGVIDEDKT